MMSKLTFKVSTVVLLFFLCNHTLFAQDQETTVPNVARFITVGFKPSQIFNDRFNSYEFDLGYEQFITKNTSLIGGISYGTADMYVRDIQGAILDQFNQRRYSVYAGIRPRFLNKGKFSLFAELQAGVRREVWTEDNRAKTVGFVWYGIGAEYRISDRVKTTLGVNSQYSATYGFDSSLNFGLQFRLGKK